MFDFSGEALLKSLVRAADEASRQEDLDYVDVDLSLPRDKQCSHVGQIIPGVTRTCSRRARHISHDHRSCEISWSDADAVTA